MESSVYEAKHIWITMDIPMFFSAIKTTLRKLLYSRTPEKLFDTQPDRIYAVSRVTLSQRCI